MKNSFHTTLAAAIEITMNRVLPLDPGYQEKLQGLSGRIIEVSLTDWQLQLFLLPNDYQFTVLTDFEGKPHVKLSGSSWDFFHMGLNQHSTTSSTVIESNIHFEGDVATGQKFAQLFAAMNIDWEEALADITGDIFAHRIAAFARETTSWLKDIIDSSQDNFGEYLHEELRLTPAKIEAENFYEDISDLVADSNRLRERFLSLVEASDNIDRQLDAADK